MSNQLRPKVLRLAAVMDTTGPVVLAYVAFPATHRLKLRSSNTLERLNSKIKRGTEVVGILPDEAATTCLVGVIQLKKRDEWAIQWFRHITLESIAPIGDDPLVSLSTLAA